MLSEVFIPDSVEFIDDKAFSGSVALTSISIPDNLKNLGANVFERNFSLTKIEYCGKLTGFPIPTICPQERQKKLDDKAAADKAAADKAGASKKSTIICVKGKLTKKVTAVNPKCPSGYKKK
jgi:hypothetical protein